MKKTKLGQQLIQGMDEIIATIQVIRTPNGQLVLGLVKPKKRKKKSSGESTKKVEAT